MMPDLSVPVSQKAFALTQEEAFALLEMCTLTLANESPTHLTVLSRLGILCREMLVLRGKNEPAPLDDRMPLPVSSCSRDSLTIACLY